MSLTHDCHWRVVIVGMIAAVVCSSAVTFGFDLGPVRVRLSAADAVVEPAERWSAPQREAARSYRVVKQGMNGYLLVPRFWAGEQAQGLYLVELEYRDTLTEPCVVMVYDGGDKNWGHRSIGAIGGTNSKQWTTKQLVVPAWMLTVKSHDAVQFRFAEPGQDLPIGKITVYRPAREADVRSLFYEQLEQDVWAATKRMGKHVPFVEATPVEPVTDEAKQQGYIPFVRSWLQPVYPNSVPLQDQRHAKLEAIVAPGEAEPVQFGLRSLDKELTGIRVTCSDLKSKDGAIIPAASLDVGVVEFAPIRWGSGSSSRDWRVAPVRIWPQARFPGNRFAAVATAGLVLPAETTLAYQLTIRTPDTTAAGVYAGRVTLKVNGGGCTFDLKVQVLPFELVANKRWWLGGYIEGQLDERACRDMAEHGCTATSQWPNGVDMKFVDGQWQFDFTAQDAYMKRLQAAGITGPHVWFQGNDSNHVLDNQIAKLAGVELDSPEYVKQYVAVTKAYHEHAQQAGWNPLIWCPFDEPGKGGKAQQRWLGDAKALKDAMGDAVRLFCVVLNRGPDRAQQFLPYADVFSCNGQVPGIVALADKAGKSVWSYGGVNQRSEPLTVRWAYGLNVWKSGAAGHFFWAYNWAADVPMNDLDGSHMDWMVCYEDLDGTLIPTSGWEALREGADDLRYLLTLESLLKTHQQTDLAKRIRVDLSALKESLSGAEASVDATGIDVMGLEFVPSDTNAMAQARTRIIGWIMQLLHHRQGD